MVFWAIASFMKAGPPGLWPQWVMPRTEASLLRAQPVGSRGLPSMSCVPADLTRPAWGPAPICPQMKMLRVQDLRLSS